MKKEIAEKAAQIWVDLSALKKKLEWVVSLNRQDTKVYIEGYLVPLSLDDRKKITDLMIKIFEEEISKFEKELEELKDE